MAETPNQLDVVTQSRNDMAKNTVYIALLLGLVFATFFLPDQVLGLLKTRFNEIFGTLASIGFPAMFSLVATVVVVAQDILATGTSRAAVFFQAQYPSRYIADKYKCTPIKASYLWFKLFNPWANSAHPQNSAYRFTIQRSFACRLIFYVQWLMVLFLLLGGVPWLGAMGLKLTTLPQPKFFSDTQLLVQFLLLLLALIIAIGLHVINSPGSDEDAKAKLGAKAKPPTGCWGLLAEISGLSCTWFEEEVYPNAQTYEAALKLLQDPIWLKAHGYPPPPPNAATPIAPAVVPPQETPKNGSPAAPP